MMPILPRQLLWKDKQTLDDMLAEQPGSTLYQICMKLMTGTTRPFNDPLKLLNEACYQATRSVFEESDGEDVATYLQDIKANVGSMRSCRVVMTLMVCLLKLQAGMTPASRRFVGKLQEQLRSDNKCCLDFDYDYEEALIEGIRRSDKDLTVELTPHPCCVYEAEYLQLNWQQLTQGFSASAISKILWLWKDEMESAYVMRLIERAYQNRSLNLFETPPEDVVDESFFARNRAILDLDEDYEEMNMCYQDLAPEQTTQAEKIARLESRIAELESENELLRSELNIRKPKRQQERAFTLTMIVDYCKKKPDFQYAEHIVAMLYKFLRQGTDAEHDLVDSIEEDFRNRRNGTITMNNPQFGGAMYDISNNNNVNIGRNGEESK